MQTLIRNSLKNENIFESFVKQISSFEKHKGKSNNLKKGKIWEEFCVDYLKLKNYENVSLLQNVHTNILKNLGISSRDMGIDIIAKKDNDFVAVQCKFRSKRAITWKDISTFEALCARSGPWKEHIIMTNSHYVHREGKHVKDKNILKSNFENLKRHEWTYLSGFGEGYHLGGNELNRSKWLETLEKKY